MLTRPLLILCLLPLVAAADAPLAAHALAAAINAEGQVGRQPLLRANVKLIAAAAHAADIAERGDFSHVDLDGNGLETIAAGERDPHRVLAGWLGSLAHQRNLLNWNVRDIAVAHVYYPSDPALPRHWRH